MEDNIGESVSLHHHFDRRFNDLEKRIDERFDAQEKATKLALDNAEKAVLKAEGLASERSRQQNEWRATVGDLTATMMPRAEYEAAHLAVEKLIADLTGRMDTMSGTATGERITMGKLYAAIGAVAAIVAIIVVVEKLSGGG